MTTTITKQEFGEYLNNFDFKRLFVEQGWNIDKPKISAIEENEELFTFNVEAVKQGFYIISCRSENGTMPLYSTRRKLENKIKALLYEHILIFCSEKTGEQVWLYTYRVGDKNKVAEIKYNINQDPERIYQRASGLIFELDEEDKITISDVKLRVNSNFAVNSEKVTKKFYVEFSKQHTNFVKLIEGISDVTEKEWYASIMLNRLMFCYFIQKRRFFDDDINYLKNKLEQISNNNGSNQFYSFYKKFLTTLFHKGLAEPLEKRDKDTQELLGNIPYLNGGIFEIHEIEQKYKNIQSCSKNVTS